MSPTKSGFALEGKTTTPIAQLNPDLTDTSSRAVTGTVGLVWPYNSTSKTLAFLLTEQDGRLRRSKGQVRVQLRGSSAAAISAVKLGYGDNVTLGLEGVEWVKDDTVPFPAARVEWQLQFTDKLVLQATVGAKQEIKRITVDHRHLIPTPPLTEPEARPVEGTPVQEATPATIKTAPAFNLVESEPTEYASPAFLKRARLSYGALFEGGLDMFDDDGDEKEGKARKRTKFGRASDQWRYTSQSPSPSPEPQQPETPSKTADAAVDVNMEEETSPARPPMTDEGVQTMDMDLSDAAVNQPVPEEPAAKVHEETQQAPAEQEQPSTLKEQPSTPKEQPPTPKEPTEAQPQQQESAAPKQPTEPGPSSPERRDTPAQPDTNSGGLTLPPVPRLTSEKSSSPDPRYKEVLPSIIPTADKAASPPGPSITDKEVAHPTSKPSDKHGSPKGPEPIIGHASHSVLFGNSAPRQSEYDAPRFGKSIHSPVTGGFGLADQVRFGFSHVPQEAKKQEQPKQQAPASGSLEPEGAQVPESEPDTKPEPAKSTISGLAPPLLSPSGPDKYYDMDSYIGPAEQEMEEESSNPFAMATAAPAVETFGEGAQWAMATEDPSYNPVEGGHYGIDALEEGTRITANEPKIRSDEIDVDKVPPGFSSYGKGNEAEIASEPEDSEDEVDQSFVPGEDFVQNEDLEDDLDDEVALEDNDHQEYNSEGEILEGGDYDQRPYNEPESDSDGLEDEKFMVEDEVFARDNHPDMIDEDEMRNDVVDDTGKLVAGDYGDTEMPEGEEMSEDDDGDIGDDENMEEYDEDEEDEEGESEDEEQGSYDEEEEGSYDEDEEDEGDDGRPEGFYDHNSTWQDRGRARMRSPLAPQAPGKPEVISLLSDSEEESDEDGDAPAPLGADFASPRPENSAQSSQQSHGDVQQDLRIHDGDIDPALFQAVASDQEEAAAKKAADEAEGAELDKAFENAQNDEDEDAAQVAADIDNQPSTIGHNTDKPEGDREAALSFDGAGSSPPKRASQHQGEEQNQAVPDQDKEGSPSVAPSTSEEQQVSSPMRSNSITDDQKPVADIDAAVVQSTDMTVERVTSPNQAAQSSIPEAPLEGVPTMTEVESVPPEVTVMADQEDVHPTAPVAAMEVDDPIPQSDQNVGDTGIVESQSEDVAHFGGSVLHVPSSPPATQSFDGQHADSLDPKDAGDKLPTPMDTQEHEVFMSQPEDTMDTRSQSSAEVEDEGVPESLMDRDDEPQPQSDVDMEDAEGEIEPSDMSIDGHGEEEENDDDDTMDVDAQLETQLRIEMTQTIVTREVVMERSVSVHPEGENVMDGEASYYSATQDMDLGAQSDKELIGGDVLGQDIKDAIRGDLGQMTDFDGERDKEVMEEAAVNENKVDEDIDHDDVDLVGEDDEKEHGPSAKCATEVVVEIPAGPHVQEDDQEVVEHQDDKENLAGRGPLADLGRKVSEAPETNIEVVIQSSPAPDATSTQDKDEGSEALSSVPEPSSAKAEVTRRATRSQKTKQLHDEEQQAAPQEPEAKAEEPRRSSAKPTNQLASASTSKRPKSSRSKQKEVVDPSIELARATLKKRGRNSIAKSSENPPESETKEGHWIHTRQHSPPGRCSVSPEVNAIIKEDSSVALARAGARSPSKRSSTTFTPAPPSSPPKDLTKRLRTTLSEYTPLKTVRTSKNRPDYFHVLAIAISSSGPPQRTKSREYVMSLAVTDPSVAPSHVVEVHLTAGHKAYLPADIQPGQGVMLKKFGSTKAGQQYVLEATNDSSWAVFENDEETPDVKPGSGEEGVDGVLVDYMRDLRKWYAGLDESAVEKLAKAGGEVKAPV